MFAFSWTFICCSWASHSLIMARAPSAQFWSVCFNTFMGKSTICETIPTHFENLTESHTITSQSWCTPTRTIFNQNDFQPEWFPRSAGNSLAWKSFLVSWFQSFLVSQFPSCKKTMIPCYQLPISCLLIDVDVVSKLFIKNLLHGSSGCFGARLFQTYYVEKMI